MEEKILYTTKTHPKILIKVILIQIFLIILHVLLLKFWPINRDSELTTWGPIAAHVIIFAFEIYYVIVPILQWYNNTFTVTNYRIVSEWGVLNKESKEIDLKSIVSVKTERDIWDRIFGCGTLIFYGAASNDWGDGNRKQGERNTGIKFRDIPKVKKVETAINKLRRKDYLNN